MTHQLQRSQVALHSYEAMAKLVPNDLLIVDEAGTSLKAHRFVLASASDYFMHLFTNDNQVRKLHWPYPLAIVKKAVIFIYEGSVNIEADQLQSLLQLADQYNMVKLIRFCASLMSAWLSPQNCTDFYLLGHLYCLENQKTIGQYVCSTMKLDSKMISKKKLLALCQQAKQSNTSKTR